MILISFFFIDVLKVFDKVLHRCANYITMEYEVAFTAVLATYFLIKQSVILESGWSDKAQVKLLVPQSKVLGPTRFILYSMTYPVT